jgi:ketosteroid isomerase-like protein
MYGDSRRTAGMEETMASTESEVKALLDSQFEAMRRKDIDQLMSLYSADIVYFDLVPPLQYVGSAALRRRFLEWFDNWRTSIGMEIRNLNIVAGGDIAAAHMLLRASGTLKNGHRRSNDGWLITHEHVSLPVDMASRSAAIDLAP